VIVKQHSAAVGKQLQLVFNQGTLTGLSERGLLERFVQGRDEAAFGALVSRHGPMVLGVCRRILRDENDVEDAFQATFLILVRRATAIRRGDLVSHWLYGVARRVAVRAKAQAARRRAHEPVGLQIAEASADESLREESRHDLRMMLDDELGRLPSSLRAPVVLCYLEGMTHDEAAVRLRWPVGTVRSRLARARDRLRMRLARQGLMPRGTALSALMMPERVSLGLIDSTIDASLKFATNPASASGSTISAAAGLARGVLQAMTITKVKILGAGAVAAVLGLFGAQSLARQHVGGRGPDPAKVAKPTPIDREDSMFNTMVKVEKIIHDMGQQQQDLQRELQRLADQILAMRAARSELRGEGASPAPSQPEKNSARASRPLGVTAPIMTGTGGGAANDENSRSNLNRPRGAIGRGDRENTLTGTLDSGPFHSELGWYVIASSQNGDRVAVFDKRSGRSKLLELPVPEGATHPVTPVINNEVVALNIEARSGAAVSKIAVYATSGDPSTAQWYPQELREPVERATPLVGQFSVAYALGRRVYAFSTRANRWNVLELPLGREARLSESDNEFQVDDGSHLYSFDVVSGRWNDLDFNAMLDPKRSREEVERKK
jgi:RNA polymerase sigma factor (sigma-70 family)